MPANLVRPGLEKYWQRAKQRAEEEGHGGDWAYVVGIYKRMTANKSMGGGEPLGKSVFGPSRERYFIQVRQGGQVPDRRRLMELAEAYRPAKPATVARLLDNGKPVYRLRDVFSGLGLDPDAEASWQAMLGPAIEAAPSEVALRQAIFATMREQKAPGELGSAVLERARKYRAEKLHKSRVNVDKIKKRVLEWFKDNPNPSDDQVHDLAESLKINPHKFETVIYSLLTDFVDDLRKAEAAGGTYYRRVKGKTGRWRYYYDQQKYEGSPDAHLDGEGASKRAVRGKVGAMLEKAGKGGVKLADLKPLTKRYGSKLVGGVLNDARAKGELAYKGGRLRPQSQKGTKQ